MWIFPIWSEPSLRGVLITYTNLGTSLGVFLVNFLNTLMAWRMVGLCCITVPLVTIVALFFIPETPHWLLSKGRVGQAEKSLSWLRGWVPKHAIADEFQALQRYSERAKSCSLCIEQNLRCVHTPPCLADKFAEFKKKRTLKSFFIVISLFVILQYSGMFAMTPYLMQIFKAYQSPLAPDKATAHFRDNHVHVFGAFCGEAASLFNRAVGRLHFIIFDFGLWLHRVAHRIQLFWQIKWSSRFGGQHTRLYSNIFSYSMEFLFVLWHLHDAMANAFGNIQFQVSWKWNTLKPLIFFLQF